MPTLLSKRSTVIRPVQQGLTLARAASSITRLAGAAKLADMAAYCLPAADLSLVLAEHATALVVAAVPLEPAARIVGMYPTLGPPDAERLAGIHTEPVERWIFVPRRQARFGEPGLGEFVTAIGHVLTAENPECQHLRRRQVWPEIGMEVTPGGRDQRIPVALLDPVLDIDPPRLHRAPFAAVFARMRRQMEKLRADAKLSQAK